MIVTLLVYGRTAALPRLAELLAWGAVAGSALQFAVQLPTVFRVAPNLRFAIDVSSEHVRQVFHAFMPVFISRGIVQLAPMSIRSSRRSADRRASGHQNAQLLSASGEPVRHGGVAAELPAMSPGSRRRTEQFALAARLDNGLRRWFFVIALGRRLLALGDVARPRDQVGGQPAIPSRLADSRRLRCGLLASTLTFVLSTFYALRDTRTPLNYALIRVGTTTVFGYFFALPLPRLLGIDPAWGAAGLTASAGIAGWIEMFMLRRTMNARIGKTGLPASLVATLWGSAVAAAAVAWGLRLVLPPLHPILAAAFVLGPYGLVYFAIATMLRVPEAASVIGRLRRLA